MKQYNNLEIEEEDITKLGNPNKPQGEAGKKMLERMNESHYEVTGWALNFLNFKENDYVLDIGCGGGATLRRMAEHINSGKLVGVDYSNVSVQKSIEVNSKDVESGKMKVLEASVENLPFQDKQFDIITTVESFYFWPNPQENLKEVLRVLKENGTFILVADIYQNGNLSDKSLENIKMYNMFNPTKDEFQKMFENVGFKNIKIHTKDNENWICIEASR